MIDQDDALFNHYLWLLGCQRKEPSWEALCELTSAHLVRIPFENISKIYHRVHLGRRWIPSLDEYLNSIECYRFGGTCYTNNYYMHLLLRHLGYDVTLCAAQIARDGSAPNGHMVNIVVVDGREAIVDVGYGAPFWSPLPRDLKEDYIVSVGKDTYVLRPTDSNGCSKVDEFRDGELVHGYLAKPASCKLEDFSDSITASYAVMAMFQRSLSLFRFNSRGFVGVKNCNIMMVEGDHANHTTVDSADELTGFICEHFAMPTFIVTEVIQQLSDLGLQRK